MEALRNTDPEVANIIDAENRRQHNKIRLIPSENYASQAVLEATGSVLTNKYSEGYAGKRYYEGQQQIDRLEELCAERARELFGAEHVNVQPYSGSPANQAVCVAMAKPGDTIMGQALDHGGHLTHGALVSVSGIHHKSIQYGINKETGTLDYDQVESLAREHTPRLIFCGATAYPRIIDFELFASIGHSVGALVVADIAHISGLVAAGVHPSPLPHVDIVTSTTHKTLRGPRGGMIMCKQEHADAIDKAVFPGVQGGPHNHTTAGLAVALKEAGTDEFRSYAVKIVENAKVLANALKKRGFDLITGGTENHLLLIDMTNNGITGKQMSKALDPSGIVCNFNTVPFDPKPPRNPSGIRLGTPAITSRGFGAENLEQLAGWIERIAKVRANESLDLEGRKEVYRQTAAEVKAVCDTFPAPGLLYDDNGQPV